MSATRAISAIILSAAVTVGIEHASAATSSLGALDPSYKVIAPYDGLPAPQGGVLVKIDGNDAGSIRYFVSNENFDIIMGGDGSLGLNEDPFLSRSWYGQTAILFDFRELDLSAYCHVDSFGFEFHSHSSIVENTGLITLRDFDTDVILATYDIAETEDFGPWKFEIPFSEFEASSKQFIFLMEYEIEDGTRGQWHSHGAFVKGDLNCTVPEPASIGLLVLAGGALAAASRRRRD